MKKAKMTQDEKTKFLAENVMGWRLGEIDGVSVWMKNGRYMARVRFYNPSTDIKWAWALVEALNKNYDCCYMDGFLTRLLGNVIDGGYQGSGFSTCNIIDLFSLSQKEAAAAISTAVFKAAGGAE